jgi:hypothetical protein
VSPLRRGIVTGLHIAGVTFFGIAVLMFVMAGVKVLSAHRSGPRTAVGTAAGATRDTSPPGVTVTSTTVPPVAPPPSPPAVSQPGQCHTADLAITDNSGQDSGGIFFGTMVVRNKADAPCTLYGYPGLQRRDGRGRPLVTTVRRDRHPPTVLVTIAPQQQASFGYSAADRPSNDSTVCGHATTVDVTAPDETTAVNVGSHLVACGGPGVVTVGPLEPGPAASIAGRG